MSEKTPRQTVMGLLEKMDKNAYSNLALDSALENTAYSKAEKAFASRLFYGITERRVTLDYIISLYSKMPLQKLDRAVKNILRMGIYQLSYMDSVPDNAAVDEAVKLTKFTGKSSASGFVNAVLRNYLRDGKKITYPTDRLNELCVKYSCSQQLAQMLIKDYGYEKTAEFLSSSLDVHKMYIRANTTRISAQELSVKLGGSCVAPEGCIELERLVVVENNPFFKSGLFHVQDLSSQLCCEAVGAAAGESILDVCAAPGGKTFTLAEIMKNTGKISACDLHEKRTTLITDGAKRLGLSNIEARQNDAKIYNESFTGFDRILCDVPCSGTGVIRSKPEIKYSDFSDLSLLFKTQYEILDVSSRYLNEGGTLVYSTCSVLKDENDRVIDRFLNEHSDFEPVELPRYKSFKHTFFPDEYGCEGFFMSKVRKKSH